MTDNSLSLPPEGEGDAQPFAGLQFPAEATAPVPGKVDVTMRTAGGDVVRCATTADDLRLTISTGDGFAAAVLTEQSIALLISMLTAAETDLRRRRLGRG